MIDVEAVKRKYRAKIKPGWPIKGDSVHFTDRFNGHKYYGTVLEWERTGPREEDIFWRVRLPSGDIISCEFSEINQVDRSPENEKYVDEYNRGLI
ncbi:hypothetical protein G5E21_002819 [Salmonella enterica]|nr:hypothetical protein [Salmonella enterica]